MCFLIMLVEYIFFRISILIFFIIPFPVLYLFSDIFYFFILKIIKYRKTVVINNLKKSFPQKSDKEILELCKKFYHHLCDITLESIKSMSFSEKSLKKHYKILNSEILTEYYEKKQSVLCLTSHYGNWEYGILATGKALKHETIALYLPLKNKYIEKYGLKKRSRFGTKLVAVQDTKRLFSENNDTPKAIILAADQSPSNFEKAIWIKFLNQDTACLHGPEGYAKKTNFPVMYLKIQKVKRGYYTLEIQKLIENPENCKPNQITEIYMKKLEEDINKKTEFWLWSHRRWKYNKQKLLFN